MSKEKEEQLKLVVGYKKYSYHAAKPIKKSGQDFFFHL